MRIGHCRRLGEHEGRAGDQSWGSRSNQKLRPSQSVRGNFFCRARVNMKRTLYFLILLLTLASSALAQHGTAENGYYPPGYNGDTWTGAILSANEQTSEITLSYTKGGKSQTF